MRTDIILRDTVYITLPGGTGESWRISVDPVWGIRVEAVGASRIPSCPDLVNRPDLVAQQRKARRPRGGA
jgi:hypothetical protein